MNGLRVLACRTARALHHLPWKAVVVVAAMTLVSWLTSWVRPLWIVTLVTGLIAGVVALVVLTWWVIAWVAPPRTTAAWAARRDYESEHAGGVGTWLDITEHSGRSAIRAKACTVRPSMRTLGLFGRMRTPTTAFGVPLLRAGWLPVGSTVWSSCEEVTLRFGGPRSGKSVSLACHALDAPGALLVTSTRTDLLDVTRAVREVKGAIDVFNPTGLGDLESSVRWSPLAGCEDLATAKRRAADLIPTSWGEAERWDSQARALLAVLLHAAKLIGGNVRTVLEWVSPADSVSERQVLDALSSSPSARALQSEIRSIFGTNERTLTSITATLLPAIRWVGEETPCLVGDAPLDDERFLDALAFVAGGRDTLYLVGREGGCRPLIGALTAEIAHQVRMHAAAQPGGRLDPPMTAILDEAPLTCGPIPLDDWTADMGGRGWTLHIAAQSPAQLREMWGHDRTQAILGNVGALLVFGGLKASDDLDRFSTLTGTRLHQFDEDDRRMVPVMTAAEIATLAPGTALLLRNGLRPVVGRAPAIWDRRPKRMIRAALRTLQLRAAEVVVEVIDDEPLEVPDFDHARAEVPV